MAEQKTSIKNIRTKIAADLAALADEDTRRPMERLVPGAVILGVSVPKLRELAKRIHQEQRELTIAQASDLMDALCAGQCREEILAGIFILSHRGKAVASIPWDRVDRWVERLDNWETCDQLASNIAGPILGAHPGLVSALVGCTRGDNRWRQRFAVAAASALNQKGRANPEAACAICAGLLETSDPMLLQAVGWALREACKKGEEIVFDFLMANRARLSKRLLREASSKLTEGHRRVLVE